MEYVGNLNKFILLHIHVQKFHIVGHAERCQANILGLISPTVHEAQIKLHHFSQIYPNPTGTNLKI
jgi:hypothetical protein